ncbi:MAG: DUF2911 domain-containing protein [Bacteroidetes bacterium]|nr:DUF2911 domain-containing protein [Bacteroidota bacterium]
MKPLIILLTILSFAACTGNKDQTADTSTSQVVAKEQADFKVIADQEEPDTVKGSIKAKAMGTIGDAPITINYYSPAVRGRIIWGGLVPYDQVWVTGAHRATNIEFDKDLKIGEKIVPPGKYSLFTIPGKDQWTLILNKNWDQHLADDYDMSQDVVRVNIKPAANDLPQERLQFTIKSESSDAGAISIRWEKVLIELPVSIQ